MSRLDAAPLRPSSRSGEAALRSAGDLSPTAVADRRQPASPSERPAWTFLTNHGHVLLTVARSADARVSEIASQVGISTRATLSILKDLEDAGYLRRHRRGRRSHYTVDSHKHFRHPAAAAHEIGELLAIFTADSATPPSESPQARSSTR